MVRALVQMRTTNDLVIRAAGVALERARHEDVRAYAERLLKDHRFAGSRVARLADRLGIDLTVATREIELADQPGPLDAVVRMHRKVASLETLEGNEFDHAFVGLMETALRMTVRDLTTGAVRDDVGELRKVLPPLLPILEQHLELALILQNRLG